jgi:hypothetical protein
MHRLVFSVSRKLFKEQNMNIDMAEKTLDELSEKDAIDAGVFIGSMAERFRCMTDTVREMNQKIEKFINKFYYTKDKGDISSEYSGRD